MYHFSLNIFNVCLGVYILTDIARRPTGLVTFCVETAFYDRLLKER
jgi:hypothetical protein